MEKKFISPEEYDKMVEELKSLKGMERELSGMISALEEKMKGDMEARGVNEIDTGLNLIRYKAFTTSRLDTKLVKEKFPEVAEVCTVTSVQRRFSVA